VSDKHPLICSPTSPLHEVLAHLPRIARSPAPVLVTGESGTGKEGVVQAIHEFAPWSDQALVAINCGAIPHHLLESELFGHVRGAFTGADRARIGRIEAADGGTLFLDEIGEMSLDLQVKLLRVLQEKVFVPVGSSTPKRADFRVVAATNQELEQAVEDGTFRKDLFFRLDVVRIRLPPLRDRPMDIAPLAHHFLKKHATASDSRVSGFSGAAMALLCCTRWPGNVRQLENVIQGALVLKENGVLTEDDLRSKLGGPGQVAAATNETSLIAFPEEGIELKERMRQIERRLIEEALTRVNGNKARAATLLGLNRTTLVEKLKRDPSIGRR
jgi:transcriptional regulator with PAS, ATPase and Fis domain